MRPDAPAGVEGAVSVSIADPVPVEVVVPPPAPTAAQIANTHSEDDTKPLEAAAPVPAIEVRSSAA